MEDKSGVIERNVESNYNNKEVFIRIKDNYIKTLRISCINVTQLPMLVKPNPPINDGKYFPYLNPEISHIYNTFDTIIKKNYKNRDVNENQIALSNTINYLNNVRYSINLDQLDFVLGEWNNKNSKLFNGLNIVEEINDKDTKDDKKLKQSHNSKYWRYYNIINIAYLYKNSNFYLPTFADFRGRIYTLNNYISYQGDDLCRSLLLFSSEKKNILNEKGYRYLLFYFANLAGLKDKYEDRIKWSEENIMNIYNKYIEDKDKFMDEMLNKNKVKEPFQYVSIMFALVKAMKAKINNEEIIINNPILFDASCSGLQHLSALSRELEIAIKTNLVSLPNTDHIPNDYYTHACSVVQNVLRKCDNNKISSIILSRSDVKRTVMTIPYNITVYGVVEQMKNIFSECYFLNKKVYKVPKESSITGECIYLSNNDIKELGKILYNTLIDNIPSLKNLNKYLKELTNILLKLDKPII
jgi:DNA-directed RNA polymerase